MCYSFKYLSIGGAFLLIFVLPASAILVSNDGTSFNVNLITGTETAAQYYNYGGLLNGGSPDFGPESEKGFFWLYEQEGSSTLQLCMIVNTQGGTASNVDMRFFNADSGLPDGFETVLVADDKSSELKYEGSKNEFEGNWNWSSYGDGGVIGDLLSNPEENSEIHIAVGNLASTDFDWYFVSQGEDKYANPLIFYDDGTFETSGSLNDSQMIITIPEPATITLIGLGIIASRHRKNYV
ncbi:hypothetical protein L21SP3_00719 [Sedimentisphaera cyanobacteriorum]|uniref:Ice-binding protein C-terminal domain-containing protein n=1 Tax=Sedimentisphaera cyanobacteriorum TaxID=1940790 RepID=A0A1Q2HNW0_9BACT|nr:PEP-CTERM sorting domain-containing protein [Sedimentisphaera cyanobacteriorum]AQQ08926.1 hypothetical protein L21SP3_00719 [Sedimentisphaera cyanobacteriorum]